MGELDDHQKAVLDRIHTGLDAAKVPIKGRVAAVTKATDYSSGMVSRILAGKDAASERFVKTLNRVYGINERYVFDGEQFWNNSPQNDVLEIRSHHEDAAKTTSEDDEIIQAVLNFLVPRLVKMDRAQKLRLLADVISGETLAIKNGDKITVIANPSEDMPF